MLFVIFHGSFSSPDSNWFAELKDKLEGLGQRVLCKQFPIDDYNTLTRQGPNTKAKNQTLQNWLQYFENKILPEVKKIRRFVL